MTRPCATREDFVCVGQSDCVLPSRKGSLRRGSHEGSSAGRARGGGGASSAQGRTQLRGLLGGARAARTLNMYCMFVTLEMSKLSGWLNADAFCAESKGNHMERGVACGA